MNGQHSEQFHERRKGMRTHYVTSVFLTSADEQEQLQGELQDISLSGMYVRTERQVAIGTTCSIRIVITARDSRLTLEGLQGQVVRRDAGGMGIRFAARFEWYVLFNIYSHFGRGGRKPDVVPPSQPHDAEGS